MAWNACKIYPPWPAMVEENFVIYLEWLKKQAIFIHQSWIKCCNLFVSNGLKWLEKVFWFLFPVCWLLKQSSKQKSDVLFFYESDFFQNCPKFVCSNAAKMLQKYFWEHTTWPLDAPVTTTMNYYGDNIFKTFSADALVRLFYTCEELKHTNWLTNWLIYKCRGRGQDGTHFLTLFSERKILKEGK